MQRKLQQRIQEKEMRQQEMKQAMAIFKISAQAAVEDSEKIFTEMIRSIEKKRSEVMELIRDQEETGLSEAEELLEKLEQQISDLKRKNTELNQLSQTEDHISFLQSFQSACVSSEPEDSSSISIHHQFSFDGVRKSLTDLKDRLEQFYNWEFGKIAPQAAAVRIVSPPEPKNRNDFLQYFCHFNLDPNTVNHKLVLSESDRLVTWRGGNLQYPDHRERFDSVYQVMSKESVCGRAYWEVEWINGWGVFISASYKGISRKGDVDSVFGRNDQSWSLHCSSAVTFCHNNVQVEIPVQPFSSRVGVYVDHGAGTLSFYNISNTMTPLYTIHTTFTQPLYAGFWIGSGSSAKLFNPVMTYR
ncbi:tripartite motif-containing protein 16-like [Astyanax mexicanus]|uniref:Tripartite motif-containing protein 16-like n=1 Tax=Astyanax mexicanus TaxID=7994 RepID=A0A8T2MLF6_ASTMX|nr:tripartite motif-containing protein 16-like [Astyanax mexicanus]